MWEDLSLEKYVMGEQKLNEKGAGFSKKSFFFIYGIISVHFKF